jgi:hypothetical protein|tara:strand:+ start:213 stop:1061 length:849 start_codon:yes stop_codon:yes gene_type:complete
LSIQYRGIEFTPVQAGSVFLGTEKGGWMYGSQRPRHEVQCPEFYVMKSVLSQSQLQTLLELNDDEIILSGDRLEEICTVLSKGFKPEEHGLDSATSWEMRCPSEGEWRHAHDQVELELEAKKTEILADGVSDNYRGAMMDGRPRPFTGIGPMAKHRTAIETHPNQKGVTALSSAPMDRELREMVARLVVTPVREDEEIRVPLNADFSANIRGEIFWTFLLGVIPSFAIPIARGMGGYATSGWANLLFGGLCAGFVTGAFWRPRRPTVSFDEVKNSTVNIRRD